MVKESSTDNYRFDWKLSLFIYSSIAHIYENIEKYLNSLFINFSPLSSLSSRSLSLTLMAADDYDVKLVDSLMRSILQSVHDI